MDYERLLSLGGELGYHLMISGAEIYRVEDSVRYLLRAYGVEDGQVFAIPNCLMVSLTLDGEKPLTVIRRIPSHGTDIERMEAFNSLCRQFCQQCPDLKEAWTTLKQVEQQSRSVPLSHRVGAFFVGASFFSLFFGGTLADALCSGLCGTAISLVQSGMNRLGTNQFFQVIGGGFVSALLAVVLTVMGLGEHAHLIIIGALMTLVPGVLLTNFMRDIMGGDMVSGLVKLSEALLTAGGIALGTALALSLTRVFWGVV